MHTRTVRILVGVVLLLWGLAAGGRSEEESLNFSSNYNENTMVNGELISTLKGNVIFTYEDIKVRADKATWWRSQGTIKFSDHVVFVQKAQTVSCDRMTFHKDEELLIADGNFDYRNSDRRVQLTGRTGRYDLARKLFTLTGQPRFMRFDSTATDTLWIKGVSMSYDDSLRLAMVIKDVRIERGALRGRCDTAYYYTRDGQALLRGTPNIDYNRNMLEGKTIDLLFTDDTLQGVAVAGKAHGLYREVTDTDTNFTNTWSDSMYMDLAEGGSLDTVRAFGDVISKYYLAQQADTANEVKGRRMVLAFDTSGVVSSARVWGNARSTYFVNEQGGRGRNDASGDSLQVVFSQGRASLLTLSGSVRGVYYPQIRRNAAKK
jgi:lipopolysaccharide export system protein LptA